MTIDQAALCDKSIPTTFPVDDPAGDPPPVLLDARRMKNFLDVFGLVTLFAAAALFLSLRDAVLVTSVVAAVVLAVRVTRWSMIFHRAIRETTQCPPHPHD
ncbi:hypothetical protein [Rhodococcoides yunnanense]|uniref:hypothetical protein n=1 Tax=Rhodococcoides yunnanense TaxID=278209 RepID=UPI0009351386|nr:hypothetical protein [Rhodococcus yunnanensis]